MCVSPTAVYCCRCEVCAVDATIAFSTEASCFADDFARSRADCHAARRAAAAAGQANAAVRGAFSRAPSRRAGDTSHVMTALPTTCRVSFACSSVVAPITLQNHLFDCSFPAFLQAGEAQMLKDMQVLQTIVPPRSCSYKRWQIVAAVIAAANELNQVLCSTCVECARIESLMFLQASKSGSAHPPPMLLALHTRALQDDRWLVCLHDSRAALKAHRAQVVLPRKALLQMMVRYPRHLCAPSVLFSLCAFVAQLPTA